jgi:hypothetical protein
MLPSGRRNYKPIGDGSETGEEKTENRARNEADAMSLYGCVSCYRGSVLITVWSSPGKTHLAS